jgi:hypothetical protein
VSSGNAPANRHRPPPYTAPGTAETCQPKRDLAKYGRDPMRSVVLDLARRPARSAGRPPGGMVATLRRNDRLLNLGHKLLAIHKAQSKIPEVAQVPRRDDLQHVDAPDHSLNPGFHQTQNQPHPHSPAADMTGRSYPTQHNSPNFAAVPRQPRLRAQGHRSSRVLAGLSAREGVDSALSVTE